MTLPNKPKNGLQPSAQLDQYEALYQNFRWKVPRKFNIATVCSERWSKSTSTANQPAIIEHFLHAQPRTYSYLELDRAANRLANALHGLGVQIGDRVAVILPQRFETAVAHIALYKLGAVAMPMSVLFGPEALEFRFQDSAAIAAIVDADVVANTREVRLSSPALKHVILVGEPSGTAKTQFGTNEFDFHELLNRAQDRFHTVQTTYDSPCNLIYTSGTTGSPKGALIPHSAMIGNLTGFVASQNWFPQTDDVFWSPADWAWTGGLMDALLPALYFGRPIVAFNGRFSAEVALQIMSQYQVTNSFLFPTALKIIMKAEPKAKTKFALKLRGLMSAGEAVGEALFHWCNEGLGVYPNEMFGQTELNYVVGNSLQRWAAKPGSIGRAYPGHRVAVIDDEGQPVKPGVLGEVAVNRYDINGHADPVFFLGYWNNPEGTRRKFTGDWCRTGDLATVDETGYLWYGGRADDMFKAAGYRIGPGEVENCLLKHPSVANVAVVPKPDLERGALVKAYVVLTADLSNRQRSQREDAALTRELQEFVRGKLAPYEYPKEIEFIAQLPMTTTGKVQRRVLRLQEEEHFANLRNS